MEITKQKAELIATKYYGKDVAFDPITIMMIVKILAECFIMIYKCYNTPKDVETQLRSPNLIIRVALSRVISKHCRGHNLDQKKLRNIILESDFTEKDIELLLKESQHE